MNRLNTKKDRENQKKSWTEGKVTEIYKDIEILKNDTPYIGLSIWKGSAGNPYHNYSYKTVEQRDSALLREKEAADRRVEYKMKNTNNQGKVLTQAAQASQTIKNILKKEYPNIKFSVKSSNFANGSSVDVSWIDGIPLDALESFLNQFQYGSFDGMTDCYNYTNSRNMPQAKYVHGHREISKEKQEIIRAQLSNLMNIENNDTAIIPDDYMVNVRGYNQVAPLYALIYQISVSFDFSKGFTGVRCEKSEDGRDIVNSFELY